MINTKKFIAATVLGIVVASGLGMGVKASWSWNSNLYDGHNGYHMAYGYFYESTRSHYSWAILGGQSSGNIWAPAGANSIANSPSLQSVSWSAGHN